MKRLLVSLIACIQVCIVAAQGVPFIKCYSGDDYNANDINFDIKSGTNGMVVSANFEGLLFYNNSEWDVLHTTENARITVVYNDDNDTIWAGGYNFFGKIKADEKGSLYLQRVGRSNLFRGEVVEIWEKDGLLHFVVNNGKIFQVKNNQVYLSKDISKDFVPIGLMDIIDTDSLDDLGKVAILHEITQEEPLNDSLSVLVKKGHGLTVINQHGKELYTITEKNGLLTNNVSWVSYNGHGTLWGASENGIFAVAIPSAYSQFSTLEGLRGDVLSITEYKGKIYAGTSNGLFSLEGRTFSIVSDISHACWQLLETSKGLAAATSNGTYIILPNGYSRQLSTAGTFCMYDDGGQLYTGENDAVYLTDLNTYNRTKVCDLERVKKIIKGGHGTFWLQNMYGEIRYKTVNDNTFKLYKNTQKDEIVTTLVQTKDNVFVVNAEKDKPFPYPLFSYTDAFGVTWLTNAEGKGLYRWKNGKRLTDYDELLYPLAKVSIRSVFLRGNEMWIGGDNGLTVIRTDIKDPTLNTTPRLIIRNITLDNDSVLWGGYGDMPERLPDINSNDRNLRITYSLDFEAIVGETVYRYKLNNGSWSPWADDHDVDFTNLNYGSYAFSVQARDAFGRESEITTIYFRIQYPFFMRWYMNILYIVFIGAVIYFIAQMRLRRLKKEKDLLEKIVEERTAEVKSAQNKLIKQEKMATVGKLTQGLIDRILNPLNYINNFSKLSEGLVKDIEDNIDDEKDHMDPENYEDTKDVLSMLAGNLRKVGEHGQNTSRTLKAMEEMLKDRTGGIVKVDVTQIFKQNEEMVNTYYAKEISTYHIKTIFEYADQPVYIMANPDLLSKVFMSLLGNSFYAVCKKAQKDAFEPEVSMRASVAGGQLRIVIHDTGIGIEETIIDKIFDPFFTTKTTGEASGIGLYLSHDIIQNYGGEITVSSKKNEYSEFTIILHTIKE